MKRQILTKIGYFLLGGLVATIGYIAGNMDSSVAQQDIGFFKKLHVSETLIVGDVTSRRQNHAIIAASHNRVSLALIHNKPKGGAVGKSDAVASMLASTSNDGEPFSLLNLMDKSRGKYKVYSYDNPSNKVPHKPILRRSPSYTGSTVVEVLSRQTGFIEQRHVILSADVKMSNGKKIHVEFTNPQTVGMFRIYDKIRIKAKGRKWEFIEHVP